MHNILFITKAAISINAYKEFAIKHNGVWTGEVGMEQFTISEDDANIYVCLCDIITSEYEPDELAELSSRLGGKPQTLIDIHIGHADRSRRLADQFSAACVERWGGLIEES